MKRLSVFLAALAVLATAASCSKDNPVAPADDTHVQFTVQLLPSSEVPVVTNSEASGRGTAVIDFTLTKDIGGAITAAAVNYRVELSGFPSTMPGLTAAHIHQGAAGVANNPLQGSIISAGEVVFTNGVGNFSRLNVTTVSAANAQAIINNPAGFYFNVHSAANPPGVARGQLVKQ
jgi:hypothetical protein